MFKFNITYVQADSNAVLIPHQLIRYITNLYDSSKPDNNYVRLNQSMPSQITFHETVSAAREEFNNSPYYLKHVISNSIVKESYVGFVITSEMVQDNPGMIAGTYYLRGGINESSLTDKPIYEANKATLLNAFGSSDCTDCY